MGTNYFMEYKQAKEFLENGNLKECIDYFKSNNYMLEYGYSLMLSGDLENAEKIFRLYPTHRGDWAIKLIPLMQGIVGIIPTYFEIRSFLEIDITLLLKSGQTNFVQYILGGADVFQNVNRESYKFLGRALLKNGFMTSAKMFLDKSISDYYRDPELHYLFVEYYLMNNHTENALYAIENCLKINSDYYPAKLMKEKLLNK